MNVFSRSSNNKGITSSKISKALAQNVLNGQTDILLDCIDLVSYDIEAPARQHVRSGTAKVIEIVALNRPDLVAPYLQKLFPALSAKELQTRSMVIRTMGFCAYLNKPVARDAIVYAERYIIQKEGLTLASSTDLFLGDFGALSIEDAQTVFPLLERSMQNLIPNEQDQLLEALFRLLRNLGSPERKRCFEFAERWQGSARKSTQQMMRKILRFRA
jgi:hypothetical protein